MTRSAPIAVRCLRTLALLWLTASAATAQAFGPEDWLDNGTVNVAPRSPLVQQNMSAAQAAAIVRSRHGGRVLSVQPGRRGEVRGYRVRILVDGARVREVFVGDGGRPSVRPIGDR